MFQKLGIVYEMGERQRQNEYKSASPAYHIRRTLISTFNLCVYRIHVFFSALILSQSTHCSAFCTSLKFKLEFTKCMQTMDFVRNFHYFGVVIFFFSINFKMPLIHKHMLACFGVRFSISEWHLCTIGAYMSASGTLCYLFFL